MTTRESSTTQSVSVASSPDRAKKTEDDEEDGELRFSRNPEPRLDTKHALNPPIVTIFGAGVAGLTAAHELVERGFLVQVVESTENPQYPGEPLVGGMAANQYGRIRANIEDLHGELLKNHDPVVQWLLRMFAFNRLGWVQTEPSPRIHTQLYSPPTRATDAERYRRRGPPSDSVSLPQKTIFDAVKDDLVAAKTVHRSRWIWDLLVRSALMLATPKEKTTAEELLRQALTLFSELEPSSDNFELVKKLHGLQIGSPIASNPDAALANGGPNTALNLERVKELVEAAMHREFLYFRLVPFYREGVEGADGKARELLAQWRAAFAKDNDLKFNFRNKPEPVRTSSAARQKAWLQLDVIELKLPGEHGYRFFPSFYRHLDDTMKRIPVYSGSTPTGRTVLDNLKPTTLQRLAFSADEAAEVKRQRGMTQAEMRAKARAAPPRSRTTTTTDPKGLIVEMKRDRATSFKSWREQTDLFVKHIGGTRRDIILFAAKMLRFMTSSRERRRTQYEQLSWRDFINISDFSYGMQQQIEAAAQVLLAFSVAEADARTYGDTATQLLLDQFADGARIDRTLNGPTSEVWLEPWRMYLESQGVRFFLGSLTELELDKSTKELVPKIVPVGENTETADSDDFRQVGPLLDASPEERDRRLKTRFNAPLLTHDEKIPGSSPDFYILALDLPAAAKLLNLSQKQGSITNPTTFQSIVDFHALAKRENALKDMTGVQLFFDSKTSVGDGHCYYPRSAWGLSSISQSEFWSQRGGFADGYLGVLSVDIAETHSKPNSESFWSVMNSASSDIHGKLRKVWTARAGAAPAGAAGPGTASPKAAASRALGAPGSSALKHTQMKQQTLSDETYARFRVAWHVWEEMSARREKALPEPRAFHCDLNIQYDTASNPGKWTNTSPYLAATPALWSMRPGQEDEKGDINYSLEYGRWAVCGTFMGTYTRMTTMEAANESARHAVNCILRKLRDSSDEMKQTPVRFLDVSADLFTGEHSKYNGVWKRTVYDECKTYNPEKYELEDLQIFHRIDKHLLQLDCPHWMDICEFDKRLKLALDASELYGSDQLGNVFALTASAAIASLEEVLGEDHDLKADITQLGAFLKSFDRGQFVEKTAGKMKDYLKEIVLGMR